MANLPSGLFVPFFLRLLLSKTDQVNDGNAVMPEAKN
jgi:hypothetical protein